MQAGLAVAGFFAATFFFTGLFLIALLAVTLGAAFFVAFEAVRAGAALAFPAEDFFPAVLAVFLVVVLRVTDFRVAGFFSAVVFIGYASIFRLSVCGFSK